MLAEDALGFLIDQDFTQHDTNRYRTLPGCPWIVLFRLENKKSIQDGVAFKGASVALRQFSRSLITDCPAHGV